MSVRLAEGLKLNLTIDKHVTRLFTGLRQRKKLIS